MQRSTLYLVASMVTVAVIAVLVPMTAAAATPGSTERAQVVYDCAVTPKQRVDVVNVRSTTNTDYSPIGELRAGQKVPAVCSRLKDGWYDVCGGGGDPLRDNWWVEVKWPGWQHAYVASLCVNWA